MGNNRGKAPLVVTRWSYMIGYSKCSTKS
jgi:hypothetical protein